MANKDSLLAITSVHSLTYLCLNHCCHDRYKDDPYDRIWTLFDQVAGGVDNFTHISNPNISNSSNGEDPDRPPLVVMQDAWVGYNSSILTTLLNTEDEGHQPLGQMYIATYFQELDENASATNVRGMTFYLNNQSIKSFNTSDKALEIIYTKADVKDTTLNLSFVQAEWSQLNPILNAFELYLILNYSDVITSPEDGEFILYLITSISCSICLPVCLLYAMACEFMQLMLNYVIHNSTHYI